MSFDNTKHDIEINSVGYRINNYNKLVQNNFVARIGGGDQKETDFSLLRSKTLEGFEGGQLQREWVEDNAFYGSEGLYPIYDDGVLYPVNEPQVSSGLIGTVKSVTTATCTDEYYIFVASVSFNSPTPRIKRIDKLGNEVVLTLPASLTSAGQGVSSMVVFEDKVWISTGTDGLWYLPLNSTTVIAITGGSGFVTKMCVYKGALYGTDNSYRNSRLYRYTGNTTTRSFVQVGATGQTDFDYHASLFVFNNRMYLSRKEGLYAYDGISLVVVDDLSHAVDIKNYRFPRALKGFLYYFMPDGMYRFSGSVIEKLYDVTEIGFPVDVTVGKNRLWILYRNTNVEGSSRFDRLMGYDYSSNESADGRVAVFNGRGMYTYGRTSTFVKNPMTADLEDQGAVDKVFWFNDILYITTLYENTLGNEYFTIDTDEVNAAGQKDWRIITSVYDGDFAMLDKSLEKYDVVFDGNINNIGVTDTIQISVSNDDFDQAGNFDLLGDIFDGSGYFINVHDTEPAGYGFKQLQTLVEGTTTAGYGIKKIITRFTVSPDVKWEWQLTTLCYGDSRTEPLLLADGTNETAPVSLLRGTIYQLARSDFPALFVDIDQLTLQEDITNVTTVFELDSTELLKPGGGFIKIDDEIMYWETATDPDVVILKRGALGTTAVSHINGAKVYPVYRVQLDINNERIMLNEDGALPSGKNKPSEITVNMKEV